MTTELPTDGQLAASTAMVAAPWCGSFPPVEAFRGQPAMHVPGVVLLLATAVCYALLLERARAVERLRAGQTSGGGPLWLGYMRDLASLGGVLALWAGHFAIGLSGPLALLASSLLGLFIYGADYVVGARLGLRPAALYVSLLAALALLPTLIDPRQAADFWATLLETLFP